ncbi:hypothetical protein VTI74DRAFT_898 [Chaetomium olivicolor]
MQLIRKRTSIPVPDVFGFCRTHDNPLCCPHIWLSFIPGISLYDFWFAKTPGMLEEDRHRCRTRVLKGVASAMVQLSQFSFGKGGRLMFDSDGRPHVDRRRELDIVECDKRLEQHNPDYMPAYFSSGLYKAAKGFYTNDFYSSSLTAWTTFSQMIGDLVGIIDWDGVGAWPKSLGNLRYPGWLTRDWDPGMYGYGSDGVLHDPEMREDLPQTLARYRKVYHDAIRYALGKHKIQGHSQTYHTSATLITENLHIAAKNPMGRGNILRKIVQEIARLVKVPCSDGEFFTWSYATLWVKANRARRH